MAYANYEGKAFRNGVHWHQGCNARLPKPDGKWFHAHAVVGVGPVRVGVQKNAPFCAVLRGSAWELTWAWDVEGEVTRHVGAGVYRAFLIEPHPSAAGVAVLVEPDGTVWTAVGAYEAFESWCEDDR